MKPDLPTLRRPASPAGPAGAPIAIPPGTPGCLLPGRPRAPRGRRLSAVLVAALLGCAWGCAVDDPDPGSTGAGGATGTGGSALAGSGGTVLGLGASTGQGSALSMGSTSSVSQPLPAPRMVSAPARPLDAGLLAVSPDAAFALASDPIGQAAYVVTVGADALTSSPVALPGEPGRATLSASQAFITLPRSGQVAVVSLANATLTGTFPVCPAPQSVALDGGLLHVACRDGQLLSIQSTTGEVTRSVQLPRDLEDVLVTPAGLVVSRLSTAELLILGDDGAVTETLTPHAPAGVQPAVAWRTIVTPQGTVLMAHQLDLDDPVRATYSGGFCGSIATPTLTEFNLLLSAVPPEDVDPLIAADPRQIRQVSLVDAAGTVDVAATPSSFFLALPGNAFAKRQAWNVATSGDDITVIPSADPRTRRALGHLNASETSACTDVGTVNRDPWEQELDVPMAVAALAAGPFAGQVLVLTHSPARVHLLAPDTIASEDLLVGPPATQLSVRLHSEDRSSTGLDLFQMDVGQGVSCASCHPMGRPDSRTWQLPRGPRRTQPLEGGVSHLGAFHWDAEFQNFGALMDDVLGHRMGLGVSLPAEAQDLLLAFVDAIPPPIAPTTVDAAAAERGAQLFFSESTQCGSCHSGAAFADNRAYDVGTGGIFVTPTLIGVGYREPLMHDGCAKDLEARFGLCGGGDQHGRTSALTEAELADLIAFLRGL